MVSCSFGKSFNCRLLLITPQSLFAMPLFDWQASSKGSIVGQYFWVYWAFAIPLTALVLGAWMLWVRVIMKRHKRENNAVRARSFFGFVSEKKYDKESDT